MSTPLIHLDGLQVLRRGDDHSLVHGISLDVCAGETVGIVGESGSGKSLTLRALMGILPPTLRTEGVVERHARTAMIFQEPATALNPTMRVGDLVARTWLKHHPDTNRKQARLQAVGLLERVGISNPSARMSAWPHELSGGMRQRVMIATALATDPDVLLCDEPTTALDVRVQAQILALLRELVADRGMAMVFVSHDLAVVSSVCSRLVVMLNGDVVETGPAESVLRSPAHEYTRRLLGANLAHRLEAAQKIPTVQEAL